jgi:hypothetical protein
MASQNSLTWLLGVRCFTFSAISWLSSLILAVAFSQATLSVLISEAASTSISQAVMSASISIAFVDGTLLAYSVILPLFSQFHLTLHDVVHTLFPDVHGKVANPIPLLFSIFMSFGWFINTVFWTHCEIYRPNGKVCPLRTRHQVMSTVKVAFGWMITIIYFAHTVFTAMGILNINGTAQLAGKARLLTKADVDGDKVQEMAEDGGDLDDVMFYQDPVVPEEKCV